MSKEKNYLVCMRKGAPGRPVIPGSQEDLCSRCEHVVLVSLASYKAAGPEAAVLCMECFLEDVVDEDIPIEIEDPSPAQIREMLPLIGRTDN